MTLKDLAEMAREMRKHQRIYFRDRTPDALNASKQWEARLDAAVAEVLDGPKERGLFDDPQETTECKA